MTADELACWNCGASLKEVPRPISRHEQCPACFEALHCCRLCRHYRTDVTGQCEEDRADPPVVKENANFCDWFRPSRQAFQGRRTERRDAAKAELQALFGNTPADGDDQAPSSSSEDGNPESSPEAAARAKLDDLFSKD